MWRTALIGALVIGAAVLGRITAPDDDREAGIREGRALQVPPTDRTAFKAGYEAGANDVFGGFDGGWDYDTPYVITLRTGSDGITYRISERRPLAKTRRRGCRLPTARGRRARASAARPARRCAPTSG